ncbi:hypothetical protein AUP68_14584 [Ilyonectria robusta]
MLNNLEMLSLQVSKLTQRVIQLSETPGPSSSRRTSISSDGTSLRSIDAAEGDLDNDIFDPSEEAYKAILEETDFFYQMFESFILSSGRTALVMRSRSVHAYAAAFIEAAKNDIPDFAEASRAGEFLFLVNIYRCDRG